MIIAKIFMMWNELSIETLRSGDKHKCNDFLTNFEKFV